jgi:hypothetical protein
MSPGILGAALASATAGHPHHLHLIVIVLIVVAAVAIVKAMRRHSKANTVDSTGNQTRSTDQR